MWQGLVVDIHVVMGAKVSSKGWVQLLACWQLWGPALLVCTTMVTGSYHRHMAVKPSVRNQARDIQVHNWKGKL